MNSAEEKNLGRSSSSMELVDSPEQSNLNEKLAFFPMPYPDEMNYSIFSRYHLWSGHLVEKASSADLFGLAYLRPYSFLPLRLDYLAAKLPSGIQMSSEDFINKNTFFPLLRPFFPREKIEKVIDIMKGKRSERIYAILGLSSSNIKWPQFFKYCAECIKDDEKLYGEPYWHRSHQPFGVVICHKHSTQLLESGVRSVFLSGQGLFTALSNKTIPRKKNSFQSPAYSTHYKKIAEAVHWLLNNAVMVNDPVAISDKYVSYLKQTGLASLSGLVHATKLQNQFKQFYDKVFLQQLSSTIDHTTNWVKSIARKSTPFVHPIQHILFQIFLGVSPEEFWTSKAKDYLPFGNKPWPCLNPAAAHYRKPVVTQCKVTIHKITQIPWGHFTCECGFIYMRSGPDKTEADRFRIDRLISGGPILHKEILLLRKDGVKTRQIEKMLNLGHGTATRTPVIRKGKSTLKRKLHLLKRDSYRREFSKILHQFPGKSRWELWKSAGVVMHWLGKYDADWLSQHLPARQPARVGATRPPIDWEQRDSQMSSRLLYVVSQFRKRRGSPIRITRNVIFSLLRAIRNLPLEKLPKTEKLFNTLLESNDDFHMRRLKYVLEKRNREGKILSIAKLKNDVCSFYKCSELLLKEIGKAVSNARSIK